jgi:chromosome segregation ATPase
VSVQTTHYLTTIKFPVFKELEARLDTNSDEKKVLLKRCIEAENDCENLKSQMNESKRKIEDLHTGLHELGREHQSLQVRIPTTAYTHQD